MLQEAALKQTDGFLLWWASYKASRKVEERIQRRISRLFGDVGEQIIAEVQERGIPVSDMDRAHVRRLMTRANEDLTDILYEGMAEGMGVGAADALERAKQAGLHLDLALPDHVFENLANHVWTASKRTMDRVSDEVMSLLAKQYEAGKGIKEAARAVQTKFSGLKSYEAKRIARTEINYSQNKGTYETLVANGIGYIQWWTASDDRVRGIKPGGQANHVIMHGRITTLTNGDFGNGLRYPGDRSGPMAEWMNCRCTGIAWFMPPGKAAPPGMSWFTEADLIDAKAASVAAHYVEVPYDGTTMRSGTRVQGDVRDGDDQVPSSHL